MNEEYGGAAAAAKAKNTPHTLVLEHVSPATRLLEKRRQMFEVQESLEAQKQEFQRREEGFKRREETLKKKDLDLQESLIRFSKFLQENDSKRSRAEKKATDEIKMRLQKEGEIEDLSGGLKTLKVVKARHISHSSTTLSQLNLIAPLCTTCNHSIYPPSDTL